ncbi:M20 family metallopeptidase [Aspergillus clavatus NRRL 1]|uniref:Probable carboxypeptidase ACLA_013260 n=1 Tax=Aspergillus clavatus (strain ATCC 1007 / CBS 513.65 / DSM 816 / NCTC 3887 / NRRL 1 / QM 1276 / 107) TaxID=344612 RepID=P20D2_ASPCL|nr:peptidase family protein [Aspergillus clavatus NRRL 1]A1CAX3.1 RecName: Full=Probable carboxypeptidase ACLA_013260; AltName: Full=Peptidase M20 domain-containing protein ACLA_013260; Flags: Precursor [Aspergillus clavatus NRRL 1]EAW12891.1 peptidase family protein [Aspergillus clavatus NRRL 1]
MKFPWLLLVKGAASVAAQKPLATSGSGQVLGTFNLEDIINASPLLSFHRDIVKIPSTTDNEYEVGQFIGDFLEQKHFTVEKQSISDSRFNVYAYQGNNSLPDILVTSHIDTVPPFLPYNLDYPILGGGHEFDRQSVLIAGRGTVDAKGSVAAQIFAVLEILEEKPDASIGLLFVVGEEKGGIGMETFSKNPSPSSFHTVIFGEPTGLNLVSGHKGVIGFNIKATGRAAHSGYPWLGKNAISALLPVASFTERLGEIPFQDGGLPSSLKYGNSTVNLGVIQGGVAVNVVPDSAEAIFSVRVAAGTPDESKSIITREVNKFTKNDPNIEVAFYPGGLSPTDLDTDVEGFDIITVNYGTDVPKLAIHGGGDRVVKRYLYGPGSILVAHGEDEALTVGDLEGAVQGYRVLIEKALSRDV